MRTMTRGRALLAGVVAAGLTLVASPADAAPGDPATVTIVNDTFRAGSWGEGVQFVVTDVPEDATSVQLLVGSMGENGGGLVADPVEAVKQADGTYTGTVLPTENTPIAPDAKGFPKYSAYAMYQYPGAEGFIASETVPLTILPGMSVTGPNEATVDQLTKGVELRFAGFLPNESVTGDIQHLVDPDANRWESIGPFTATFGPDGDGEGLLTIINASAGDQFRVMVTGEEGSVQHYIRAIENADEPDTPGEQPQTPQPPTAPKKPQRVDTGV